MSRPRKEVPAPPAPDFTADGRPGVEAGAACADPARALLYDRVTRYFEKPLTEPMAEGTCKVCGRVRPIGDTGFCRAQRTLTSKNHAAPLGVAPSFGGPRAKADGERGSNALASAGVAIVASPGRCAVATRVIPLHPLPPHVEAFPTGPEGVGAVRALAFGGTLPTPFLFALTDKKSDVPLGLTTDPAVVVVSGAPTPHAVDAALVGRLTAIAQRVGVAAFKAAARTKRDLAEGRPDAPEAMRRLLEEHPGLMAEWHAIAPHAQGREADLVAKTMESADD